MRVRVSPQPNPLVSALSPAALICAAGTGERHALPTIEAVSIAVMQVGILIANGYWLRQSGKDELTPQSQHDAAQSRSVRA